MKVANLQETERQLMLRTLDIFQREWDRAKQRRERIVEEREVARAIEQRPMWKTSTRGVEG